MNRLWWYRAGLLLGFALVVLQVVAEIVLLCALSVFGFLGLLWWMQVWS